MGLLSRQPGIALFTVVEAVGLAAWLALARGTSVAEGIAGVPEVAGLTGSVPSAAAVGLAVLFVALAVEHLLTDATVNGFRFDIPLVGSVAVSATETALWALWLAIAEVVGGLAGVALAGLVLFVLLVPQHTVEDSGLRGHGPLSDLFDVGTLGFSFVEALGASVWLALIVDGSLLAAFGSFAGLEIAAGVDPELVGLAVLTVLLFVEHNMGVGFATRTATRDRAPGDEVATRT